MRSKAGKLGTLLSSQQYMAPIIFFLLFAVNCVTTKNFFSINTVWNLIMQSTANVFISIGVTIVISGGGIDIAIGSTMAICAIAFAFTLNATGSVVVAFLAAIVLGAGCGAISGVLIAKFKIQAMIATMAMMYILRSLSKVVTRGATISYYNAFLSKFAFYRIGGIPIQVFIILVVTIAAYLLVNKTKFGVYVEACGDNYKASYTSGIRVVKCLTATYAICGVTAALAGIQESLLVSSSDPNNMGLAYEMDAIAATIVGGTAITGGKPNIIGTVFGAFTLKLITQMINMNNIQFEYSYIVKAVVIILAVLIRNINWKKGQMDGKK